MISHYFQRSTERYFPCMMHGWNAYANDNNHPKSYKHPSVYKITRHGHEIFFGTKQSCWMWLVNRFGHVPAYDLAQRGYLIEKVMEGYDGNAT